MTIHIIRPRNGRIRSPTSKSFTDAFMDAIAHHGYLNEPVIGNTVEIIRELHDDGNEIIIGTNRGFSWLEKS